jgi:SNF2 family DNA or RNA helicase
LVNPEGCPKNYSLFRDSVLYKVTQFKWAVKPQAQSIVHRILQPAIRFEKSQCLDLPKVTHVDRDAPLTPQQTKYYKLLKTQMCMQADGEQVSAVNAATNLNKLLQISGGAVYSDTGEVVQFDVSNRINAVLEVIRETNRKVLVFVPFTHTIELLRDVMAKEKISCEVINGKVNLNKRSQIVADFQSLPDPRVLIIQPQAASHGLTLTEADTIIWYAPVTSVETYLQANARIDRPGQKHPMTIVHISGSEVEHKLYKMLRGNIENHQKIIDLYRQEILQST